MNSKLFTPYFTSLAVVLGISGASAQMKPAPVTAAIKTFTDQQARLSVKLSCIGMYSYATDASLSSIIEFEEAYQSDVRGVAGLKNKLPGNKFAIKRISKDRYWTYIHGYKGGQFMLIRFKDNQTHYYVCQTK